MEDDKEVSWHNDGHVLVMQLNHSAVKIIEVICPHASSDEATCRHADAKCAVEWFINRFGLDCNVGVCPPQENLQVAWTFAGEWHHELDQGQIWVMPVDDEAFSAWIITQQ